MEWYYRKGDQKSGPITPERLREMVETGDVKPDTLLWRPGMAGWVEASLVPGVFIPPESSPPPAINGEGLSEQKSSASPDTASPGLISSAKNSSDGPSEASPQSQLLDATPPSIGEPLPGSPLRGSDEQSSSLSSSSSSEQAEPPADLATPWIRFWARMFDWFFLSGLVGILIGAARPSLFEPDGLFGSSRGEQLLGWALLPLVMVIDAAVYSAFGNTLGKWIAGVKVLDLKGEKVPFSIYLKRNFRVWWSGIGTGFPLITLFTLSSSHKRATKGELMSWDTSNDTRVYAISTGAVRTWSLAILYFLVAFGGAYSTYFDRQEAIRDRTRESANALAKTQGATIEQQLRELAAVANQSTPVMIDKSTRYDRAEAGPGLNFTYHYTIVDVLKTNLGPQQINEFFHGEFGDNLRNTVCTGEDLAEMLRNNVTVHFHYVDQVGEDLATLSYNSATCGR